MFESCSPAKILCKSDRERVYDLIASVTSDKPRLEDALTRLQQVEVLDNELYPENAARIGTVVSLKDMGTGSVTRFELIESAAATQERGVPINALPVASPLGLELLGMRVGDHLKWSLPSGHQRYLLVDGVASPEEVSQDLEAVASLA